MNGGITSFPHTPSRSFAQISAGAILSLRNEIYILYDQRLVLPTRTVGRTETTTRSVETNCSDR